MSADDLRRLRRQIDNSRRTIDEAVTKLTATLRDIHWRDPERDRFERELLEVVNRTKSFVKEAERLLPILDKKARAIDMYRGR